MRDPRLVVELADVEARERARPATYVIPPRDEREDLWPGDLAKVVVVAVGGTSCGERIWVRVGLREAGCHLYRGTVVSFPATAGLHSGDELRFGPEHVSDVHRAVTAPSTAASIN